MPVQSLEFTAVFKVWDAVTGLPVTGDAANLTIQLSLDGGALATATNTPSEIGNGLYSIVLTGAEMAADAVTITGTSTTADATVLDVMLDCPDFETTDKAASSHQAALDHGDINWVTASGFSTPQNVTDTENAILARGNAAWMTATGFSTPADIAASQNAIISAGNSSWTTATGFATPTDVTDSETAVIAAGNANWTTATMVDANVTQLIGTNITQTLSGNVAANFSTFYNNNGAASGKVQDDVGGTGGGGGEADWTTTERSQIRHRLGIDGDVATPAASPDLANNAKIDASEANVITEIGNSETNVIARGDAAWVTATGFATPGDVQALDPNTVTLTEAYPALGQAGTLAEAICLIQQSICDFNIVGTNITVRQLNGSAAALYSMDSATLPTERSRTA